MELSFQPSISPDETAVISRDLTSLDPTLLAHAEMYRYGPSEYLAATKGPLDQSARSLALIVKDALFVVFSPQSIVIL